MLLVGAQGLGGEFRLPDKVRVETLKRTGSVCHLPFAQGGPTQQTLGSGQRDARV